MHGDGQHGMRSLASLSEALKGRGELETVTHIWGWLLRL